MSKQPKMLMSDAEVLKRLGAKDFRSLTKKNVVEFISLSSLNQVDPKVAIGIIEQFPNVAKMASELADKQVESLKAILESNNESVREQYEQTKMVADILRNVIENENSTPEERMEAIKGLDKVLEHNHKIDKRNKDFLFKVGMSVVGGISFIAITALGVLGLNSKMSGELPDLSDQLDDIED